MAAIRKMVGLTRIENLLDAHIRPLFPDFNPYMGNPHHAFTAGGQTFNISKPHAGCVKKPYIMKFLDAMAR